MKQLDKIFEALNIPQNNKKKMLRRYEKIGICVTDGMIADTDADQILLDTKEYICINEYIAEKTADQNIVPARAVSDIRRYLVAEGMKVLAFSDTTFAIRPNTHYVHKDNIKRVDEVIDMYVETVEEGLEFTIPRKSKKPCRESKSNIVDKKKQKQMNELIGINEYLTLHDEWENHVRTVANREKAYFYLEDHDCFGIEKIDVGDIVFEKTGKNPYYIYRKDIPFLDEQMEKFFLTFGLSEEEKFKLVINLFDGKETLSLFADYLEKMDIKVGQPAVVETAWLLAELPDELINMKNEDIMTLLQLTTTKVCKRILRDFANWLRQERDAEYGHLLPVKQESEPVQAYTVEEYHEFSICVFNEEQIKENHMIEKALMDIRCVGMWTYHTIHTTGDLRGTDIEKIVQFYDLRKDPYACPELPRDPDRLAEMLINNEISDETFLEVGEWFIMKTLFMKLPTNKTNAGEVILRAIDDLKIHYGRLLLIAEVHYMRGADKLISSKWFVFYSGRLKMKEFYGERMGKWLGRGNFSRDRMNHTVSQMEEMTARSFGMDGLTAVTIAGHSRGHISIGSMIHYIGDHNLTGEDAAVVLWTMMKRKVFGAIPYLAMMSLYPDSFGKLNREEQTEILELSGMSALELEAALSKRLQLQDFEETFRDGSNEQAVTVFKTMLAIGQGFGASLDDGGFCTYRARGYACPHDVRGSCVTADCKCNILTKDILPTLVKIIKEKQLLADAGDTKAKAVLEQRLKPKFKQAMKCLKGVLSKQEMIEIKTYTQHLLETG